MQYCNTCITITLRPWSRQRLVNWEKSRLSCFKMDNRARQQLLIITSPSRTMSFLGTWLPSQPKFLGAFRVWTFTLSTYALPTLLGRNKYKAPCMMCLSVNLSACCCAKAGNQTQTHTDKPNLTTHSTVQKLENQPQKAKIGPENQPQKGKKSKSAAKIGRRSAADRHTYLRTCRYI